MTYTLVSNGDVPDENYFNALMKQSVIPCTSGTRPTPSHEGMAIWETDTDLHAVWDGAAWIYPYAPAWSSWTPVIRNNGISGTPASISTTVDYARYKRIRDIVHYHFSIVCNAVAANGASVSLPVSSPALRTHHAGGMYVFGAGSPSTQIGLAYQGGGPATPWDRIYIINSSNALLDFPSGGTVRASGSYAVG